MKSLKLILRSLVSVVFLLILFLGRGALGGALREVRAKLNEVADRSFSYTAFRELSLENDRLKAELKLLERGFTSQEEAGIVFGELYSRYPFNDKSLLMVNRGTRDGVRSGMPVLIAPGVLLGKITEVRNAQSEIETIFDPEWKSSVAIGGARIKALLKGGSSPRLEFIPRDAKIEEKMGVVNVSKEFPLHIFIGTLGIPEEDPNNAWISAPLQSSYALDEIEKVSILTAFP